MPVNLEEFGENLKQMRLSLGKTLRRVEIDLLRIHGKDARGCTHGSILKDEKGRNPDIPFYRLEGYARIYKMPIELLYAEYIKARHGIDYTEMISVKGPGSITDVVVPRNAKILEMVNNWLESPNRGEVVKCLTVLNRAFSSPNIQGKIATSAERKTG